MKKILPVLLLMILATQMQAQYKPVLFGLKLSSNLGWVKTDAEGYESEGVKMGFSWGFIIEFFMMENYAIMTGFNMNFNGGKMSYPYMQKIGNDVVMTQDNPALSGTTPEAYHNFVELGAGIVF